jgi:hypothetical protein
LVVVRTAHPTPDVEAHPKEKDAGSDQRGDADGEDRLLHVEPNRNPPHSVPFVTQTRSRDPGLVAPRLKASGVGEGLSFFAANAASPVSVWALRAHRGS